MGSQPLGRKWVRRIQRVTGLDIVWGSSHGGYTMAFTTADHRHGLFDLTAWRRGDPQPWTLIEPGGYAGTHFSSCSELFPGFYDNPVAPLDRDAWRRRWQDGFGGTP